MTFKASLDKTAIIITCGVTALFSVIIGAQMVLIKDESSNVHVYTTIACVLIYLLSYLFRPMGYRLTAGELVVRRPAWDVRINRADIISAELLERKQIRCSLRTFGVGGLFGYYGSFANFSLGAMTWYVTRRDRPVLIRTRQGKKIILSPNEPELLVKALQE